MARVRISLVGRTHGAEFPANRAPAGVHTIRLAQRPLLPRVVLPLKGRSSGSRINRVCTPSQLRMESVALMCSSSPVTATGSRRIFTGFPQVRSVPRSLNSSAAAKVSCGIPIECGRSVPSQSSVRASLDLRPKYTLHRRWSLRISPPLSQPQRTGSFTPAKKVAVLGLSQGEKGHENTGKALRKLNISMRLPKRVRMAHALGSL